MKFVRKPSTPVTVKLPSGGTDVKLTKTTAPVAKTGGGGVVTILDSFGNEVTTVECGGVYTHHNIGVYNNGSPEGYLPVTTMSVNIDLGYIDEEIQAECCYYTVEPSDTETTPFDADNGLFESLSLGGTDPIPIYDAALEVLAELPKCRSLQVILECPDLVFYSYNNTTEEQIEIGRITDFMPSTTVNLIDNLNATTQTITYTSCVAQTIDVAFNAYCDATTYMTVDVTTDGGDLSITPNIDCCT